MPPKEERMRECPPPITRRLGRLLECYGIRPGEVLGGSTLYCTPTTVMLYRGPPPPRTWLTRSEVAAVGVVAATRGPRGAVLPALGLLSALSTLELRPRSHYVRAREPGATLFLYGRDLLPASIAEARPNPRCAREPLIVMSEEGDLIGYGRPERRRGELLIRNVLDAGWYLRSGV